MAEDKCIWIIQLVIGNEEQLRADSDISEPIPTSGEDSMDHKEVHGQLEEFPWRVASGKYHRTEHR